ncbi:MFS transporter [Corynebacterium pacaense]|uniref:MFS transporter n=1 Tax=Corynebacterium pacaense TaxID=1816684 RepID=UPI0009B9D243|nr:MFS transporter [Corynebacterium pacaense]
MAKTHPTRIFALIAVLVAALNLRTAIVSVGSVLDQIIATFGASEAVAGIITAIPGLMFGIFGVAAVPLARRLGLSGALSCGMVIALIGLTVRPWVGDIWSFIFFTGLVVVGIAIANILLPAWIKLHGGANTVALMTVYTTLLGVGSTIGPLPALLFGGEQGWRWAMFVWAFLGLAQVLVWLPMWGRVRHDFPGETITARGRIWTSPSAIFIMLFFGLQSMNAYIQMGWLPKILVDAGVSTGNASIALSIVGVMGIVGGFTMPVAIARTRDRNLVWFPVVFGISMFLGYLGTWAFPLQGWWLWALLLGLGGLCFPMAIALIPARTRDPHVTASLSGFAQPVGYVLAALGPLVVGALFQLWGTWSPILLILAGGTIVLAAVGYRAARKVVVDDELEAGGGAGSLG